MYFFTVDVGDEDVAPIPDMLHDDTNINYEYLKQPIYSGAGVSVLGAYCSIMQYAITNSLNDVVIGQLLKLLQVLCPKPNLLPKSFYKVKTFFKQFNSKTKVQKVCCVCSCIIDDGLNVCNRCDSSDTSFGQFAHIPVNKMLQTIVSSKLFGELYLCCIINY